MRPMRHAPSHLARAVGTLAALAVVVALAAACGTANATPAPTATGTTGGTSAPMAVAPGRPFTLAPGQSVGVGVDGWRLAFVEATADSRCPANASCVRAGDVTLHFTATSPGGTASALTARFGEGDATAAFGPYTLTAQDVAPQPISGRGIPASAYRVTLVVR